MSQEILQKHQLHHILEGRLVTLFPGWGCLIPLVMLDKKWPHAFWVRMKWGGGGRGGCTCRPFYTQLGSLYSPYIPRVFRTDLHIWLLLYRFFSWLACQKSNLLAIRFLLYSFTIFLVPFSALFCFFLFSLYSTDTILYIFILGDGLRGYSPAAPFLSCTWIILVLTKGVVPGGIRTAARRTYHWATPHPTLLKFMLHSSLRTLNIMPRNLNEICTFMNSGSVHRNQKSNSWTYNFVEVSWHNLKSFQTWGFHIQCLHYKAVSNHFCSRWGGGGG